MSATFAEYAASKTLRAQTARIGHLLTEADASDAFDVDRIGTAWTRDRYDGAYFLPQPPSALPAVTLVFVRSRDGNTVASDPSALGGGDTDRHLIYEGLSRAAADAVLAGARTAAGAGVFSAWHPEIVGLRESLGLPRHPIQIVVSRDGRLDFDGARLFNTPEVRVILIAGRACRDRCRPHRRDRPWIEVVPFDEDLTVPLSTLRARGVARIQAIGGRTIASALIDAGLVQDVCLTTTSIAAGEPDTPFYAGTRVLAVQTIVRKRSRDLAPPIVVEQLAIKE